MVKRTRRSKQYGRNFMSLTNFVEKVAKLIERGCKVTAWKSLDGETWLADWDEPDGMLVSLSIDCPWCNTQKCARISMITWRISCGVCKATGWLDGQGLFHQDVGEGGEVVNVASYAIGLRCGNCNALVLAHVPIGKRIEKWSVGRACPACGCEPQRPEGALPSGWIKSGCKTGIEVYWLEEKNG